jgi:hypothetical protein
MDRLRIEAQRELIEDDKKNKSYSILEFDPLRGEYESSFNDRIEDLARSRLKKAMAEAGLS